MCLSLNDFELQFKSDNFQFLVDQICKCLLNELMNKFLK